MDFLKRVPLHPFLFAAYSVLALTAINMGKFVPWMALRSLIFFILVTAATYWLWKWLFHNPHKIALVLTLCSILFFTYGHIYRSVQGVHILGLNLGWHRNLLLILLIVLAVGIVWIIRRRQDLSEVTRALNIILIFALCFPIFQILRYEIQAQSQKSKSEINGESGLSTVFSNLKIPAGETPPDVYYIILDSYGRSDTLLKYIQYDNRPFLTKLKAMGFYVAECSQSNYAYTEVSLGSTLNLDYLDVLGNGSKEIYKSREIDRLLHDNVVRRIFKNAGYQVVSFASGYSPTEWKDADVYLTREGEPFKTYLLGGINPFEALELQTTAGVLLFNNAKANLPDTLRSFFDAAYTEHRERMLYALDKLSTLPKMPGPKFVFLHILAPHSPFVFGAHGEIVGRNYPFTLNKDLELYDPEKYIKGYRDQVQYLDQRILQAVQTIIQTSPTPPIIILQGDHGPRTGLVTDLARMGILNAYYLPGSGNDAYASITPVNTFRLVFNRYFGGQLELLPDISFFSSSRKPDVFTVYQVDPASCNP